MLVDATAELGADGGEEVGLSEATMVLRLLVSVLDCGDEVGA